MFSKDGGDKLLYIKKVFNLKSFVLLFGLSAIILVVSNIFIIPNHDFTLFIGNDLVKLLVGISAGFMLIQTIFDKLGDEPKEKFVSWACAIFFGILISSLFFLLYLSVADSIALFNNDFETKDFVVSESNTTSRYAHQRYALFEENELHVPRREFTLEDFNAEYLGKTIKLEYLPMSKAVVNLYIVEENGNLKKIDTKFQEKK